MADEIVNITHRFVYEVDTSALDKVAEKFRDQLKMVDAEMSKLNDLKKAYSDMAASGEGDLSELTSQIEAQEKAVDELAQSLIGMIQSDKKLQEVIQKDIDLLKKFKQQTDETTESKKKSKKASEELDNSNKKLTNSTDALKRASFDMSQILRELPAFTYSAQTGILALSNNLPIMGDSFKNLSEKSGGFSNALVGLAGELFSLNNVFTLAVAALAIFGDKLFDTKKKTEEATDAINDYLDALKSIQTEGIKAYQSEASSASILVGIINDENQTRETRLNVIKQLRGQYAGFLKDLSDEQILNGEGAEQLAKLNFQLGKRQEYQSRSKAIAQGEFDLIKSNQELTKATNEVTQAEKELADQRKKYTGSIASEEAIADKQRALDRAKNNVAIKLANRDRLQNEINTNKSIAASDRIASQDLFREEDKREKKKKFKFTHPTEQITRLPLAPSVELPVGEIQLKGAKEVVVPDVDLTKLWRIWRLEILDQRRQMILDIVSAVNDGIQLIGNMLNFVNEQQIKNLDLEVKYREDRMKYAVEIARRGNTAILEEEQKRLDEANKAREIAGRRQIQINAALAASESTVAAANAIAAVTKAAETGAQSGGVIGLVVSIIAAVGAIAASIIAIRNAFSAGESTSFAEGGFTGSGGRYQRAGIVHKGEFVTHQKATAAYRPYLEMMNRGTFPMVSMDYANNSQAAKDNKKMLGKMDEMINAVKDNQTIVHNRMDSSGWWSMTERFRRNERRRWS